MTLSTSMKIDHVNRLSSVDPFFLLLRKKLFRVSWYMMVLPQERQYGCKLQ